MTSTIGIEERIIFLLSLKLNLLIKINPKRKEIKKRKTKNSTLVFKGIPEKRKPEYDGINKVAAVKIIR